MASGWQRTRRLIARYARYLPAQFWQRCRAARLSPSSWDGSRILVAGFNGRISLRDWRQGRDLWKACSFEAVAVRPAAADFMVGLHGRGPRELRIVDRDGQVTPILGDILPATADEVEPPFRF